MTRNKLYAILLTACVAGYGWLTFTYYRQASHLSEHGICIFKQVTTIPCPSCGATRSVLSLMNGDVAGALYWNPLGLLLISMLAILPFWLLYDVVSKKESVLIVYRKAEQFFRRKWIAIPAILMLLVNWLWNINKGL